MQTIRIAFLIAIAQLLPVRIIHDLDLGSALNFDTVLTRVPGGCVVAA